MRPTLAAICQSLLLPLTAGLVWGLGLARALAESFPTSPTFYLFPGILLAFLFGVLLVGVRRWLPALLYWPLFLPTLYIFWPLVAPNVGWALLGGALLLTVLSFACQWLAPRRCEILIVCVLALTVLALYLHTLGASVGQADTFEFQVVAPTLGVAHPTGYPLYILSGKLFSLIPYQSVAWRVNLTSAVFATLAALVLYRLVLRLVASETQESPVKLVAALTALAFALSRVFWSQAVVAEVYALHNLFVAIILWLLFGMLRQPSTVRHSERASNIVRGESRNLFLRWPVNSRMRLPQFYILAFALGLSFSNHLTTALLLPAVALTLFFVRPRFGWQTWLKAGGLFLLGLSLYLYLYFRWPALHDGVWMSWGEFWRYITGQQFGDALRLDAWYTDPTRYEIVWRLLKTPFGWPGLILAALGLTWLAFKRWRAALITGGTFAALAFYALCYYVPDVSVFVLPAHLILALWMGCAVCGWLSFEFGNGYRAHYYSLLVALYALLPLSLLWTNLPKVDQSHKRDAYLWGQRVLDLPVAPHAAILADSVKIAPLYYLQHIEGRRSDLDLLVLANEAIYRAELESRIAAGQTVYLARFLPGLEGHYYLRSLGPLTEVGVAPLDAPPPLAHSLDVRLAGIDLLGVSEPAPDPAGGLGLSLYWRAAGPIEQNYHVRLRLRDAAGRVCWQSAGRHPVDNYYPTLAWRSGEVVVDHYQIPDDPARLPGRYTIEVALFLPFDDAGGVADDVAGQVWRPALDVDWLASQPPPPARLLRARFAGGSTLLGFDLPDTVLAGGRVELDLVWHTAPDGQRLLLTWLPEPGDQAQEPLTLDPWRRQRLTLDAPLEPGRYRLRLALLDAEGAPLTAYCGWLARPTQACSLATVTVQAAASTALANLDAKMLLLEAELGAAALRPGEALAVNVRWQALQALQEDYTVSVQLLGPDGRLYGQVDAWPVQGTLPTSQWSPGQTVDDPYHVQLLPGGPPGRYQVVLAVYLLRTQTRLLVLDADGKPLGDHVVLGEVDVP